MDKTRFTQKALRALVEAGAAVDVSLHTVGDRRALMAREGAIQQIGAAVGKYGLSGLLFVGETTGTLYAVIGRTSALFIYF